MASLTRSIVYNEEAFQYLLEGESKRSKRTGDLYNILLINYKNEQGTLILMEPNIAKTVIAAVSRSLRDTDYIGWYREGHILGGVLTVLGPNSEADVCSSLRPRLVRILRDDLGVEESCRLQIRVCQPHELEGVEAVISSFNTDSCVVLGRV